LSSSKKRALNWGTMRPLRVAMQTSVDGMFAGFTPIQFNAMQFSLTAMIFRGVMSKADVQWHTLPHKEKICDQFKSFS
jgi:hypothetical protein